MVLKHLKPWHKHILFGGDFFDMSFLEFFFRVLNKVNCFHAIPRHFLHPVQCPKHHFRDFSLTKDEKMQFQKNMIFGFQKFFLESKNSKNFYQHFHVILHIQDNTSINFWCFSVSIYFSREIFRTKVMFL